MDGRGLVARPRDTPPAGVGSGAVPSPLQSSCRVCSRPGMEMDLAVLGGLRDRKKTGFIRLEQIKTPSAQLRFTELENESEQKQKTRLEFDSQVRASSSSGNNNL